jgi:hypothetical protein
MASSGPHSAPTMIQLPCITPVAHDHLGALVEQRQDPVV